MLNGQRYRGIRSFLLHKRNEPKKGARQSASSCVFIIEWGENFFRLFPLNDKYSGASWNGDKKKPAPLNFLVVLN